jgi:hypothetical protein
LLIRQMVIGIRPREESSKDQITLPGFMMPAGSKAAFTRRMRSMATGGAVAISSSRFRRPMPCSAEI